MPRRTPQNDEPGIRRLIREGDLAFHRGDLQAARRLYMAAHDQALDSPADHRLTREKLVRVDRELGNWGPWLASNLLLIGAPLGSFRMVARLHSLIGPR